MIVEMAGRPAEHLKEALERHIGVLNDVKDIRVHEVKLTEPRSIEGSNGMFTAFAEADFECESFARLSETMFDFMPSSVEVIDPPKVVMTTGDATNLLNNISGRMHRYDEFAKIAGVKINEMKAELEKKEKEIEKLKGSKKKSAATKKKVVTRNSVPSKKGTDVPDSSGKKKK